MILPGIERRVLGGIVVEDLQFAHAGVGRITLSGIANRQAVVATGRNFKSSLTTKSPYSSAWCGMNATFSGLHTNRAVGDFIIVDGSGPAFETTTVEERREIHHSTESRWLHRGISRTKIFFHQFRRHASVTGSAPLEISGCLRSK